MAVVTIVLIYCFFLSPDTLGCSQLGANSVLLIVEDGAALRDSCTAIVTLEGPDEDCDGVADECDLCPSGNDNVDHNQNGIPDCTEFSTIDQVISEWRCGPLLDSIFVCSIVNGDPSSAQTFCVPPAAVNDILSAGGYVGPCGNTPCGSITPTKAPSLEVLLTIYPNPANNRLYLNTSSIDIQLADLVIYNSLGQIIRRYPGQQIGSPVLQVPTVSLKDGLYYLQLQLASGQLIKKAFVIASLRKNCASKILLPHLWSGIPLPKVCLFNEWS